MSPFFFTNYHYFKIMFVTIFDFILKLINTINFEKDIENNYRQKNCLNEIQIEMMSKKEASIYETVNQSTISRLCKSKKIINGFQLQY